MKKAFLVSAVAATLASTSAMAAPELKKMVDYVNVSLGSQSVDVGSYDSGMALIGTVGKDMSDKVQNLSAEVEMSKTVSESGFDQTIFGVNTSANTDIFSLGGYAVYNYPASPQLKVRGKAGLLYESITADACVASVCASADDSKVQLSYGVGATWGINKNFNILGEYTILESDVSNLSFGMKYNFD